MTREEAVALRHRTSQERSQAPKLKREIAALLEVCIILGGGDGVLAHIRDLKDVKRRSAGRRRLTVPRVGRNTNWPSAENAE